MALVFFSFLLCSFFFLAALHVFDFEYIRSSCSPSFFFLQRSGNSIFGRRAFIRQNKNVVGTLSLFLASQKGFVRTALCVCHSLEILRSPPLTLTVYNWTTFTRMDTTRFFFYTFNVVFMEKVVAILYCPSPWRSEASAAVLLRDPSINRFRACSHEDRQLGSI